MKSIAQSKNHLQVFGPLQDYGLFKSQSCRTSILFNFKHNRLFKKSLHENIKNQNEFVQGNDKSACDWLEDINCIEQSKKYEPKHIFKQNTDQKDHNIFETTLFQRKQVKKLKSLKQTLTTNCSIHENEKSYLHQNNMIKSTISQKSQSHHHDRCYMEKLSPLKSIKAQLITQKQQQFKHIWPHLKYTSLKQSIRKLKSLDLSQVETTQSPFFEKKQRSEKISSQPVKKLCISKTIQKQNSNQSIPAFLLASLRV